MNSITFLQKKWRWILALAFIIYLINIVFYNINSTNQHKNHKSNLTPYYIVNDTTTPSFSNYDSLPCKKIMAIKDSIKHAEEYKQGINDGYDINGSYGDDFWGYAYVSNLYKKNLLMEPSLFNIPKDETALNAHYFIILKSFELKDSSGTDNFVFYHKAFVENNNRYYIKYLAKDGLNKGILVCHYVYKEIPVKYIAKDKMLLSPVSYKLYKIAIIMNNILQFIYPLLFCYFIVYLSFRIVVSISRGKPFEIKNIKDLSSIAYYLLIMPFFLVAIKHILHQIFINKIPEDFSFQAVFKIYFLLAGIVVFLIAKAFKRGHDLQKEQELTI